jgi:hypothetical protein
MIVFWNRNEIGKTMNVMINEIISKNDYINIKL